MVKGLKNANLALMFFLELGVLASLVYWGFATGSGLLAKIGLGLGALVLATVVWGLFGAPRGKWHLYGFSRVLLEVVFFGSAVVALFVAGHHTLSGAFALLFVLNAILRAVWKQDLLPASA
jgi:hypothetical protein